MPLHILFPLPPDLVFVSRFFFFFLHFGLPIELLLILQNPV